MTSIFVSVKKHFANWNQKQLDEGIIFQYCEKQDIEVIEQKLHKTVKAMLWFVSNQYVLVINSQLFGLERKFGMCHELGHYILHSPNRTVGTFFWGDEKIYRGSRREENEADAFAYCAIIPLPWLKTKTFNDLLDEGFSEEMIWKRKNIYEKYKI